MKKTLLIIGLVLGASVFSSSTTKKNVSKENDKITICHIPPGNPGNTHEITISVNALQAHLDHGDHIGSCDCDCFY